MRKLLLLFLILPCLCYSQSLKWHVIYPYDTAKVKTGKANIQYEVYYTDSLTPATNLNDSIKRYVFNSQRYDLSKSTEDLLKQLYKKEKITTMLFSPKHNQNGLFSVRVYIESKKGGARVPLYIHYDLNTRNLFNLNALFKTNNNIYSFEQAVCSTMADSIRIFEQSSLSELLAKGSISQEKYSKIIERLNTNLSVFKENYLSDFIITDKGIEEDFDCILPRNLLPYNHTYKMTFTYKTLKYMVKEEYLKRLTK